MEQSGQENRRRRDWRGREIGLERETLRSTEPAAVVLLNYKRSLKVHKREIF
jgi:hypothetical protein